MKFPVCDDAALKRVPTTQGVEIDRCPACQGVWLERGEIFLFTTKAQSIAAKLEQALANQKPTDRLSPASGCRAASSSCLAQRRRKPWSPMRSAMRFIGTCSS